MTVNPNIAHEQALASLAAFLKDDVSIERQRAELQLEKLAEEHTMLLDTSAVLHAQFPAFAAHLAPVLKRSGKAVLLPVSVIRELKTLGVSRLEVREQARSACDALQMLQKAGVLHLCGDERDGFSDKAVLMIVNQYRMATDLLVITQDCQLSRDLLQLNELESVSGKAVSVFRVTRYGYLSRYLTPEEQQIASAAEPVFPMVSPKFPAGAGAQVEVCLDCGRPFTITQEQAERFRANGLMLPRRCYPCRQVRKQTAAACRHSEWF